MDSKQPLSDPNIPTAVAQPILMSQTKGNAVSGGDGRTYYCEKCHAVRWFGIIGNNYLTFLYFFPDFSPLNVFVFCVYVS